MLELLQIHPTGKDIKTAVPVYIITKTGSDYTDEGIAYIKEQLEHHFNEKRDFAMYTGLAINKSSFLKDRLKNNMDSYVVLSTKENVIFVPQTGNEDICHNIDESITEKKDETTWEILMKSCHQELY